MFGAQKCKRTLRNTTALVAVVMLAAPTGARATDFLINAMNSPFTGPLILGTGDNVNVTNTGLITSGSAGVTSGSGNITGGITNSGTISGNSDGIAVQSASNLSGGITNESGGIILGSNTAGIVVQSNSDISGGITNSGTISGRDGILVQR